MLTLEEWRAGYGKNLPRTRTKSDKGNKDGFSVLMLTPRICLIHYRLKKAGKGGRMERLQTAYIGFNSIEAARKLRYSIEEKRPGAKVIVRESERVLDYSWELKIWEYPGILEDVLAMAENIRAKAEAKAEAVSIPTTAPQPLDLDTIAA
jgi:hypothetical protein